MTQSQQPRRPMFTEFCLEEDSAVATAALCIDFITTTTVMQLNVMHMITACCNNIIVLLKHPNSMLTV